jgi:serine/threonine protein kinase
MKKTGFIDRNELDMLLTAVQNDDIDLESLIFGDDDEKNKGDVVTRIMKEYGTENVGVLSKEEFMKLGDMILSKYEARHKDDKDEQIVGEWVLTHTLGEGGYGVVKLAYHIETNVKRAVKKIKRGNVSDMSKLDIEIQVRIILLQLNGKAMKILKHPNVVQLYEVIEDSSFIYLVMELCGGGSLYEYLKDNPFDEDLARYYFTKLLDGLTYCHEKGVCHRDLRLENLLLDNSGNLKISDFGQAGIFKKGWDIFSTQLVGSLYHLSPEQINNQVYSGEKIDIWNAGIILYCFLTSRLPFCSTDVMEMFNDIKNARYTYPNDIVISEDAKNLIAGMLQVVPQKRLTLAQIRNHPWFNGTQKKPQLSIHNLMVKLNQDQKLSDILPVIRELLEHTLQSTEEEDSDVHVLKCVTANEPITPSTNYITIFNK